MFQDFGGEYKKNRDAYRNLLNSVTSSLFGTAAKNSERVYNNNI
jgi:hypothetical protein